MKRIFKTILSSGALLLVVALFGRVQAQEPVEITYWLWDVAQIPQYEQCAADFEALNPNISITIEQHGG